MGATQIVAASEMIGDGVTHASGREIIHPCCRDRLVRRVDVKRDQYVSYQAVIRLLGAIPIRGRHSTANIVQRVNLSGKPLEKRSVERGLANLADQPEPPILRDGDRSSGYYWSWVRNHPLATHAHRESAMVETLLLHRMAHHLMPPTLAKQLAEEERRATGELAMNPNSNIAWWLDRVIALPPGPQRFPLKIQPGVFEAVSEALWKRQVLRVEYRNRTETGWKALTLHPQGIVQDGYLLYLVATVNDYTDPRHLALMRMRSPEILAASARILDPFDFKQHVARQFDWPYDEPQLIEFWISADRKIELEELPISQDQKIDLTPGDDGYHRVRVTVTPNHRLDSFLASFGEGVYFASDDDPEL